MKPKFFWTIVALLVGVLFLLNIRRDGERNPVANPLSNLPNTLAGWTGGDLPIEKDVREILGAGDFLSRTYARRGESSIGLFIAYFPTQRTGSTIHSPKNCLPGAGWTFDSSRYVDLKDIEGKSHRVGEYVVANGDQRQFIIYWYQMHGRSVANEYMAKIVMVSDAIRMGRTDGALVRVSTPIVRPQEMSAARARTEAFSALLWPLLSRYVPD